MRGAFALNRATRGVFRHWQWVIKRNAKLTRWSTWKSKTLDQATIMLDLFCDK